MKKLIFSVLIILGLVGTFVGGRWSGRQEATVPKRSHPNAPLALSSDADQDPGAPGTIKITPDKQQLIGVRVQTVERKAVTHTVRLLGRVAADETRVYTINATVDGWITKALPNTTGSFVKKNEILAVFYSPEFIAAAQGLFVALSAADRVKPSSKGTPLQMDQLAGFKLNSQQYLDSLKNLGMSDSQIERMTKNREWYQNVDLVSPADGLILSRNVSSGLRFTKGTELYRIADLRRVWILADVYGNEAHYFKPGVEARVTLPDRGTVYRARVGRVPPAFDAATRTLKVRLEANNPGSILRPDMFVDVELPITHPPAITVPSDAVVDSGRRKTVFIDRGNGSFEPREVKTGWRSGDQVEISQGLNPGERIAVSGTFLIDSESRMELAASGITGSLSRDPVSGMEVSIKKAEKSGHKSFHQGKTYYFASKENKARFDRDPGRFAENPSK